MCDERWVDVLGVSVRRLAVITGLSPMSEGGSVESVIAGLGPVGWELLRRPRVGAACADHVVLGPGGAFLIVLHRGGGSVRPEWADEARAVASALARLTRQPVTPVVVLERATEWSGARRFHGVGVVPVGGLARYLVASGNVLAPGEILVLREALRIALAA
jgi:hypothetical protein